MTGFGRILSDLNASAVRYVLIGGIALIRHGVVRATRDVDAIVEQTDANYERIASAAETWRATRPDGSALERCELRPGRSVHLSTPHGDVDLLPPLSGYVAVRGPAGPQRRQAGRRRRGTDRVAG